MKGYFRNASATDNVIDSDGFLHTGDIGYYSNDNYIFFADRLKELIKVKGFQVSTYLVIKELTFSIRLMSEVAYKSYSKMKELALVREKLTAVSNRS